MVSGRTPPAASAARKLRSSLCTPRAHCRRSVRGRSSAGSSFTRRGRSASARRTGSCGRLLGAWCAAAALRSCARCCWGGGAAGAPTHRSPHPRARPQTRKQYRKRLLAAGYPLQPDQHISHIIAESRGGANHPHNFIVLGKSANVSLGNGRDHVMAFLAGREQTAKAVEVSALLGNMLGKQRTPLDWRRTDANRWLTYNYAESFDGVAASLCRQGGDFFRRAHAHD